MPETRLADTRTTLGVVEHFFQAPLSDEMCRAVSELPVEQAWQLLGQLNDLCDSWFRGYRARSRPVGERLVAPAFQPIFDSDGSVHWWPAFERWLKCGLLYYPGQIVIPDPITTSDG